MGMAPWPLVRHGDRPALCVKGGAKETARPLRLGMRPLGICKPLEELKATETKEDGVPSANLARVVSGGFALLRRTKWLHHSDLEQDPGSTALQSESPFLLVSPSPHPSLPLSSPSTLPTA